MKIPDALHLDLIFCNACSVRRILSAESGKECEAPILRPGSLLAGEDCLASIIPHLKTQASAHQSLRQSGYGVEAESCCCTWPRLYRQPFAVRCPGVQYYLRNRFAVTFVQQKALPIPVSQGNSGYALQRRRVLVSTPSVYNLPLAAGRSNPSLCVYPTVFIVNQGLFRCRTQQRSQGKEAAQK